MKTLNKVLIAAALSSTMIAGVDAGGSLAFDQDYVMEKASCMEDVIEQSGRTVSLIKLQDLTEIGVTDANKQEALDELESMKMVLALAAMTCFDMFEMDDERFMETATISLMSREYTLAEETTFDEIID